MCWSKLNIFCFSWIYSQHKLRGIQKWSQRILRMKSKLKKRHWNSINDIFTRVVSFSECEGTNFGSLFQFWLELGKPEKINISCWPYGENHKIAILYRKWHTAKIRDSDFRRYAPIPADTHADITPKKLTKPNRPLAPSRTFTVIAWRFYGK